MIPLQKVTVSAVDVLKKLLGSICVSIFPPIAWGPISHTHLVCVKPFNKISILRTIEIFTVRGVLMQLCDNYTMI